MVYGRLISIVFMGFINQRSHHWGGTTLYQICWLVDMEKHIWRPPGMPDPQWFWMVLDGSCRGKIHENPRITWMISIGGHPFLETSRLGWDMMILYQHSLFCCQELKCWKLEFLWDAEHGAGLMKQMRWNDINLDASWTCAEHAGLVDMLIWHLMNLIRGR